MLFICIYQWTINVQITGKHPVNVAAIDSRDYDRANNWILFAPIIYYVDLLFIFQRILTHRVYMWVLSCITRVHTNVSRTTSFMRRVAEYAYYAFIIIFQIYEYIFQIYAVEMIKSAKYICTRQYIYIL